MNYGAELFVAKIKGNAIIVKSMCGCWSAAWVGVCLLSRFHVPPPRRPQLQMNLMNSVLFYAGLLSIKQSFLSRNRTRIPCATRPQQTGGQIVNKQSHNRDWRGINFLAILHDPIPEEEEKTQFQCIRLVLCLLKAPRPPTCHFSGF